MAVQSILKTLRGACSSAWSALFGRRKPEQPEATATATANAPLGGDITVVDDQQWTAEGKFPLEPHVRVGMALLELRNPRLVYQRLGIVLPGAQPHREPTLLERTFPLHLEVSQKITSQVRADLQKLNVHVPKAYECNGDGDVDLRHVTAHMELSQKDGRFDVAALRKQVQLAIKSPLVNRLNLALPLTVAEAAAPAQGETMADLGIPKDRKVKVNGIDYPVRGKGVVIGVIDDGCCFAHWNFLMDGPCSRIAYIWDQGRDQKTPSAPWVAAAGFPYGCELVNVGNTTPLDDALQKYPRGPSGIDEDSVYKEIGFPEFAIPGARPMRLSSHGTHVMDIAAGNGRALFGREGVAPDATLIFVQLPAEQVAAGGGALTRCIEDGAAYIFARAKQLESLWSTTVPTTVPAVVNVSFGGHIGPHDGTAGIELALDKLLAVPNRAIVMAAGNGFAAACHTDGRISYTKPARMHWRVPADDESFNVLEIWYRGKEDVLLSVTPPGSPVQGPWPAGPPRRNIERNGNVIGFIDYVANVPDNGDHQITIYVFGTADAPAAFTGGTTPKQEVSPPGTWLVELTKPAGSKASPFHAWIERDERRRRDPVHRRQTTFPDEEAHPRYTLSGIATGHKTITVGGYNAATNEVAEYSACGPTRTAKKFPRMRQKPEVCAASAADARGRGVLSASTRFELSTRLNGTSASAPHVAGLAALVLQLNKDLGKQPLPIDKLRDIVMGGADDAGHALRPNMHQAVDSHQRWKHRLPKIWAKLKGHGPVNAEKSLKRV